MSWGQVGSQGGQFELPEEGAAAPCRCHPGMSLLPVTVAWRASVPGFTLLGSGQDDGRLFRSQSGRLSCLLEVNLMSLLFQTERTSPFCARKCFCPGGRACVTLICSHS